MKRQVIKIVFGMAVFLSFTLSGCMDKCKDVVLKNYITEYAITREVSFTPNATDESIFVIQFSRLGAEYVSYSDKGEDLNTFTALAHKNKDTTYREVIECGNLGGLPVRCFSSVPITKINITCDKEVDAQHPAHTSLNDLFLLLTYTPDRFIKNGYQPIKGNDRPAQKVDPRFASLVNHSNFGGSVDMVYGTLAAIDFSNYQFVGFPGHGHRLLSVIAWITPPSHLTNYTLTAEITYADGLKREATLEVK